MVQSGRTLDKRPAFVIGALQESLRTLTGRIVLDVGCGNARTLHAALVAGAAWGGWDRAAVVADTQALLFSLVQPGSPSLAPSSIQITDWSMTCRATSNINDLALLSFIPPA